MCGQMFTYDTIYTTKFCDIDLNSIMESGQCFRWNKIGDNTYSIVAFNQLLIVDQLPNGMRLHCSESEFESLWKDYFDLDYDYQKCIESASNYDQFLRSAAKFSFGLRILNQDPWEMLITFIISQQNNIPRIKGIIDRLCRECGDLIATYEGIDYYSFPTELQILDNYLKLKDIGVGFRDKYIIQACKDILFGFDLEALRHATPEDTVNKLKSFYGVGDKVANCISLFGLGHKDAFPRDVWINRIIDKYYDGEFDTGRFEGFSGVIQQYMFYYERSIT